MTLPKLMTPRLHPFDYCDVRLLDGPFQERAAHARDFYSRIPDDDILKGFRRQAGLPAPGEDMGGWCADSTSVVFGQWLSGMARLSRAMEDVALADKATFLMKEWGKTLPRLAFGHYDYDKYVGGLVDMARYADRPEALPLLAQITDRAETELGRDRLPATDADSQGGYFNGQLEWYTLPENLYRAYALTGDVRYRDFAAVWHYPHYWGMFTGENPPRSDGFHGYSHVNTLNSAAMAYAVTGEASYLNALVNAYDYFQATQCYATGGYGPGEKLMPPDGSLGRSLGEEPNATFLGHVTGRSFETPCGTWGAFKLVGYLMQYTGAARYGDWMERLLYNGIGAALPMHGRGETFYYADYRLAGGRKSYFDQPWPCCSGTYLQNVAEFYNVLYFLDDAGLYVNLYVPSEVTWDQAGRPVTLTQRTDYPRAETVSLRLDMAEPVDFALRFRIPGWAMGPSAEVNGQSAPQALRPGSWGEIRRLWSPGDRIALRLPLQTRAVPIDPQHPHRVAHVRGPVVLVRPGEAGEGTVAPEVDRMVPFSQMERGAPYRMYFDLP